MTWPTATFHAIGGDRLADVPLIRADLLLEIERRYLEGASTAELVEVRAAYRELLRRR